MCSHWYQLPPLPYNAPQSLEMPKHQAYWSSQWIPHFHSISEGFTSIKVTDKEGSHYACKPPPPPSYNVHPTTGFCPWDFVQDFSEELKHDEDQGLDIFYPSLVCEFLRECSLYFLLFLCNFSCHIDAKTCSCDSKVSKTTIVVKVNGDVNVCFSPLLLEASQRYVIK